MKLAQFIQTEMGQLLEDWDEDAKEIAPELKGKDSSALRDHAREMLEFISQDLVTSQTEEESARRTLWQSPRFGHRWGAWHAPSQTGSVHTPDDTGTPGPAGLELPRRGALRSRAPPQKTSMNWCGSTRPSTS